MIVGGKGGVMIVGGKGGVMVLEVSWGGAVIMWLFFVMVMGEWCY